MNEIRVSPVVDARAETVAVSFPSRKEEEEEEKRMNLYMYKESRLYVYILL